GRGWPRRWATPAGSLTRSMPGPTAPRRTAAPAPSGPRRTRRSSAGRTRARPTGCGSGRPTMAPGWWPTSTSLARQRRSSASAAMPAILLVRHGQALDPLTGDYDGLSPLGEQQAVRVGEALVQATTIARLVAGPLIRQQRTA